MRSLDIISDTHEVDAFERAKVLRISRDLRPAMKELLLQHADGPQDIVAGSSAQATNEALRVRGLLMLDNRITHRKTMSTALGRRVIAVMLAAEADALCRRELHSVS